tara:strand:- start:234 stop:470 length:237 start_codon:yes stop_codon:yes gene_type:complete
MEMDLLWSAGLTGLLGIVGWVIRSQHAETQRMQVLLNKTREEMARDYMTKVEANGDMNRIIDRLEALDAKLDRIIERR